LGRPRASARWPSAAGKRADALKHGAARADSRCIESLHSDTRAPAWTLALLLLALALGLKAAFPADLGLDYEYDAGPAIDTLVRGDFQGFADTMPLMGPLSALVRAPFVWLVFHADVRTVYIVGSLPCIAAVAALVLWLKRLMTEHGRETVAAGAIAAVCLVNLPTLRALHWGHPEELLTGALVVGAAVAALRGRALAAAVLLGLAFATKQWALIALPPVLLAAPAQRGRIAIVSVCVAAAIYAPFALASPDRFSTVLHGAGNPQGMAEADGFSAKAGTGETHITAANVWWPVAEKRDEVREGKRVTSAVVPHWVVSLSHGLIVLLAVPLAWLYRRRGPRPREDALALLALLLLARCALDPNDFDYYHVPLLLALGAWEGITRPGKAPWATLTAAIGTGISFLPYAYGFKDLYDFALYTQLTYMAWALPLAVYLGREALSPRRQPQPAAELSRASLP
jgi:hypothetical protein